MVDKLLLLLAVTFFQAAPLAAAPTLAGDYRGVLHLDQTESDLLARMHLIATRTEGNDLLLTGFLTLYLGDFRTDEYVSFAFDDIRYDLLTGELVFDQTDRDVSMRTIAAREGELEFAVRSQWAGLAGHLVLVKDGAARPVQALLPAVSGTYSGSCDGEESLLDLQTVRIGTTLDPANPYGVYKISGRVGTRSQGLCPNAENLPCVTNVLFSGSYDLYRGHLNLIGRQGRLSCDVTSGRLDCGPCVYQRDFDPAYLPAHLEPTVARPAWNLPQSATEPLRAIEGSYVGYLHHERLDQYQPLTFDLTTYRDQGGDASELQMSAVARLVFGGDRSHETLVYRFERQPFQLLADQYLFTDNVNSHDARPVVTVMDGENLAGFWYSTTFGRVGSFKLQKSTTLTLPASANFVQPMTSNYTSQDMTFSISVDRSGDGFSAADPFAPLHMTGYFWYRSAITRRIPVTAAGYDFYTGKIGFETDDGERLVSGRRLPDGTLALRWQGLGFGTLMQSGRQEVFHSSATGVVDP